MSDRSTSRRSGRSAHQPSPAALGLVRVADDFAEEFPDGDRSSTECYASLIRTGTALSLEVERSIRESFDVPHPAATALAVIEGADEPLTPSQISERVLVASATMTATLDLLERRGWVVRRPNAADRRSVLVEITDDGRAVVDRLLPGIRVVERSVMATLTDRERQQLLRMLDKILAQAATVAAGPPVPLEGTRVRGRDRSPSPRRSARSRPTSSGRH